MYDFCTQNEQASAWTCVWNDLKPFALAESHLDSARLEIESTVHGRRCQLPSPISASYIRAPTGPSESIMYVWFLCAQLTDVHPMQASI